MANFENYRKNVIDLGEEALKSIIETKPRLRASTLDKNFIIEYARKGESYSSNNKIRFMVVGRTAGKFGEVEDGKYAKYNLSILKNNNEIRNVDREKIEECFDNYSEEKIDWIHDEDKKKGHRFVDAKPFFRFAKMVYLRLMGQEQDFEWYKNICISNIYKVISPIGGNPSWRVKERQEKMMLEIMKAEIEFFRPTHILVIDGERIEHCWCENIKDNLKDFAKELGVKIWFSDRPEIRKAEILIKRIDEVDKSFWEIKS